MCAGLFNAHGWTLVIFAPLPAVNTLSSKRLSTSLELVPLVANHRHLRALHHLAPSNNSEKSVPLYIEYIKVTT